MKKIDEVLYWDGYGGKFNLAAGRCRLRLFDLTEEQGAVALLKPIIVVVNDLPRDDPATMKKVTVRSCIGHIATTVVHRFKLDPSRMMLVEYSPRKTYGLHSDKVIPEKFELVDLKWHSDKAMFPSWRPLPSPLLETVRDLIAQTPQGNRR